MNILFVCHGNICRSPMAEFILKELVRQAGMESRFRIASAATSREELGNPLYPPARQALATHGIPCSSHAARQITKEDYSTFDLIIGMDEQNRKNLLRFFDGDPEGKISLLLDHTPTPGPVADPWYTGDFEAAWRDINRGCRALLAELS